MREVLKDFGVGVAAMLFTGLMVWGAQALGTALNKLSVPALPAVVGIACVIVTIVAFTYFIGRFLRGK